MGTISTMTATGPGLTAGSIVLLTLAIGLALAFEFVNGFHDTANAVATVIYTHSLRPWAAVIWSGLFNLMGVLWAGGGVAFAVLSLLPSDMVTNVSSDAGFAMVFSILVSAILWNLGTWYFGLPASSSHTLLGAIVGVGLAHSLFTNGYHFGEGVNWTSLQKTTVWLLLSPLVGFVGAGLLILIGRKLVRWPAVFKAPVGQTPPPPAVRGTLIATCTGVSFFHGANDGQKGMGLILLILIGILPGTYAMKLNTSAADVRKLHDRSAMVEQTLTKNHAAVGFVGTEAVDELNHFLKGKRKFDDRTIPALAAVARQVADELGDHPSLTELSTEGRKSLRTNLYLSSQAITKLTDGKLVDASTSDALQGYKKDCLMPATQFIPFWVKLATAVSLGLGTMIGWKRIVVTVGEKIGKQHLTYAQGASAELVAAATIAVAEIFKQPVSTTHVLSSGVAGTMAANGSGVQWRTVRNLILAWVLTLPVCVLMGAGLFAAGLMVVLYNLQMVVFLAIALAAVTVGFWRLRRMYDRKAPRATTPAEPRLAIAAK